MTVTIDRRCFAFGLVAATSGRHAVAAESRAPLTAVPNPRIVGKGRLEVLMVSILDVTLYSPNGVWTSDGPFALQVDCLTRLSGKGMARRAAWEMRAASDASEADIHGWERKLQAILPDVDRGDTLYSIRTSSRATEFFRGREWLGRIDDVGFSEAFFAICLGTHASHQALRQQLLGLS